jgi:hypothetical protein
MLIAKLAQSQQTVWNSKSLFIEKFPYFKLWTTSHRLNRLLRRYDRTPENSPAPSDWMRNTIAEVERRAPRSTHNYSKVRAAHIGRAQ